MEEWRSRAVGPPGRGSVRWAGGITQDREPHCLNGTTLWQYDPTAWTHEEQREHRIHTLFVSNPLIELTAQQVNAKSAYKKKKKKSWAPPTESALRESL